MNLFTKLFHSRDKSKKHLNVRLSFLQATVWWCIMVSIVNKEQGGPSSFESLLGYWDDAAAKSSASIILSAIPGVWMNSIAMAATPLRVRIAVSRTRTTGWSSMPSGKRGQGRSSCIRITAKPRAGIVSLTVRYRSSTITRMATTKPVRAYGTRVWAVAIAPIVRPRLVLVSKSG